jgi:hypothetical protein
MGCGLLVQEDIVVCSDGILVHLIVASYALISPQVLPVCNHTRPCLWGRSSAVSHLLTWSSVKACTPALDYVGLRTVIEWIMVAHVDSSDCRCRCIGKIIARDLRLVASRLYKTGVTRSWTRHVQPCRYIIPLFRRRPPGLPKPVYVKRRKGKQGMKQSSYVRNCTNP